MAKGQIKQKQATINQKQFESLCAIQCTQEEILSVLDLTDKTLNSWCNSTYGKNFSEVFAEKRQGGKASLRRMQWLQAEKNPTMAIWLGKQYLKQKDVVENQNIDMSKVDKLIEGLENMADYVNEAESIENTEHDKIQ